ncbi:MAG TPA: hypothetical protein VMW65_03270, partial [Chloroflexota bacterium]|nr:hypothetical protein [Chloroflexota bacterium]
EQIDDADVVLVLFNGHSGSRSENSDIGVCHDELQQAVHRGRSRIIQINLPDLSRASGDEKRYDDEFKAYAKSLNLWHKTAKSADEAIDLSKQAIRSVVMRMITRGVGEARRERYDIGDALDWTLMTYQDRKAAMERAIVSILVSLGGKTAQLPGPEQKNGIIKDLGDKPILIVPHGVPAAMSESTAREMVGQPFLRDHDFSQSMEKSGAVGPVHFIACNQGITEAQARRQLGFPDATILSTSFGIYVADNIQKIQILFLKNCRDRSCVQQALRKALDWLMESGEGVRLGERAEARSQIVAVIDEVKNSGSTIPKLQEVAAT